MTMSSSNSSIRGYSDFFTSGFRAVASRVRRRPTSVYATTAMSFNVPDPITAFPQQVINEKRPHRARPTSMIIPSRPFETTQKRARRASIVPFRSWWSGNTSSAPSDKSSGNSSSRASSRRNSRVVDVGSPDLPEVWIAAGGPFTPTAHRSSQDAVIYESVDPFSSSPDSKSIFIDLTESLPSPTPKSESFLSLTGSSPDRPFLQLPQLPRRERPTSVQTMPLPSRSRRSSLQYRPPSRDKSSEFSWILEEESLVLPSQPLKSDVAGELNDPANIDWRQFHVDLLLEES